MLIDEQVPDTIKNATQVLNFYVEFEFGENVKYFSSSSFVVNTTLHYENFTALITADLPVLRVGLELTLPVLWTSEELVFHSHILLALASKQISSALARVILG